MTGLSKQSYNIQAQIWILFSCLVGNKAEGRISKRVFQEKKARQIFLKNENFLSPDTHTYVCVSGGKKCSFFRNIWRAVFLKHLF